LGYEWVSLDSPISGTSIIYKSEVRIYLFLFRGRREWGWKSEFGLRSCCLFAS
jgi:hypothetical protein